MMAANYQADAGQFSDFNNASNFTSQSRESAGRDSDDEDSSNGGKKKSGKGSKRRKVNHACLYCRRSHMTCDEGRPCQRWYVFNTSNFPPPLAFFRLCSRRRRQTSQCFSTFSLSRPSGVPTMAFVHPSTQPRAFGSPSPSTSNSPFGSDLADHLLLASSVR